MGAAEQGLTSTSVNLDAVRIQEKALLTRYEQVKLDIQTQALRRHYQIDDMRRQIRVTEARLAYDGQVLVDRDGTVLDLQVIQGQTVATGQRLGTLGRATASTGVRAPILRAVAYFAPADARRLPAGLPVEVVPLWDQRGRFGGIMGKVTQVLALPATEEDISTTIGNPQLAHDLLKRGPVMRTEIELERDPTSRDGYRWTLSGGSGVFPVREGLTIAAHAYVEWCTPITYVIPGLRSSPAATARCASIAFGTAPHCARAGHGHERSGWWQIRNPLLRQEVPWLVSEVVLLVILGYRMERWIPSRLE